MNKFIITIWLFMLSCNTFSKSAPLLDTSIVAKLSFQSIKGDNLNIAIPASVLSSFSGRFSGMQVTTASGSFGGGTRVIIRGLRSFMNDNQPLIVVDGIPFNNSDYSTSLNSNGGYDLGSMANDLNLWDIDTISVLTPSHSAIYGSRGANGVVSILTKSGKYSDSFKIGVNYNSSISFEKIAIYPKFQKLYGGGYSGKFEPVNIDGADYLVPEYKENLSWGPRYDSNISVLPWYAFDPWDTENYMKAKPWIYPKHDYTSFFETANGYQNNVQVFSSYKFFTAKVSYTNFQNSGIYPNSKQNRNTLNFNSSIRIKRIAEFCVGYTYIESNTMGRPSEEIGNIWDWSQTSLDYSYLKSYMNPDGSQRVWNRTAWNNPKPAYDDNPYWNRYKNVQNDSHDRHFLNTSLSINIFKWLSITGRLGVDSYDLSTKNHIAVGSSKQSSFASDDYTFKESNVDLFLNVKRRFISNNFGINALAGISEMKNDFSSDGGFTNGGLVIPDVYSLENSLKTPTTYYKNTIQKVRSYYANLELDYKNIYSLELVVRKEKPSYLKKEMDFLSSKSINFSAVLSNFNLIKKFEIISYSRIHAGFTNYSNHIEYFGIGVRYNRNLKLENQNHFEVGTELYFYKNRLGFEINYFNNINRDQVMVVSLSQTSGYNSTVLNGGKTINKGFEFRMESIPVKLKEFIWKLGLNLSTISSTTNFSIGIDGYTLGSAKGGQIVVMEGRSFPYITGRDYAYSSNGEKLISSDGKYVLSLTGSQPLGKVTPDFTAGVTNTLTYKNFTLSLLIDIQRGGHMYYSSYRYGIISGLLEETSMINDLGVNFREDFVSGGGVILNGVYNNTNSVLVKNTTRIDAKTWAESFPTKHSVFSTDYIKLREVSIGYDVPVKFTHFIKGFRVSAYGRNLAIWGAATKHFDPEFLHMAGSNAQGIEQGYLPGVRTFGFSLNMSF